MAFPNYIPTRRVSIGGAMAMESGQPLIVQASVISTKSLVWNPTGYRFEKTGVGEASSLGGEVVFELPCTDTNGWRDPATNNLIDVSAPGSYSHMYTVTAQIGSSPAFIVGPFVLPAGDGSVVDLDKFLPVGTTEGQQVLVPDSWSQQVEQVVEAAAAAAADAVNEELDGQRIVRAEDVNSDGIDDDSVISQNTKSGKLLIGWAKNGSLSKWTRAFFRKQVADSYDSPKIPGVYHLERTPTGYATRIIYDDGRQEFPGLVVASDGSSAASGGSSLVADTVGADTYLTDISSGIRFLMVPTDRTHFVVNGTSTFAGMSSQFTSFATAHGATLVNTATAGVGAEHTLAKLGSRPLLTSGTTTISATGTSPVTSSNVPSSIYNAWSAPGYFEGFPETHGTISKPGGGGAAAWTFTRDADGSSFTVPAGTKFIPDASEYSDAIIALNIGKNNLSGGVEGITTNVDLIIQWTNDAYAWATSTGKSVIVVGHFYDTGSVADAARARIAKYNDAMRTRYGARFVDMGAYVGSVQIFNDLGLTPDAADLDEINLGNKAPQISAYSSGSWPTGTVDPLHLSIPARGAVVDRLIGSALTDRLKWMLEA